MSHSDYHLYTRVPWDQTMRELRDCFSKWRVRQYNIWPVRISDARNNARVVVEFSHPSGQEISLVMERQPTARDNLRVLYLAIDAMRLNEKRGLGDVMREAYVQLPAPAQHRDPFEVLGIRPDADIEIVHAAYRAAAKAKHPDVGGSEEAMTELNDAYQRVLKERGIA